MERGVGMVEGRSQVEEHRSGVIMEERERER